MKNNVNLYHPQYQPKLRLLSLPITLGLWVFAALCCGVTYFYLSHQHQKIETEFATLEQKKQQQDVLFSEIQLALNNIQVDPNLLNQVVKNQKIISHKQRILTEITGQEKLKTNGFSKLMVDLARHHQVGLWLTHINLNGLNVLMEGAVNESAMVPKWINILGQTEYFKGQEFADTRVFRDNNQQLNFVIATGKDLVVKKVEINE